MDQVAAADDVRTGARDRDRVVSPVEMLHSRLLEELDGMSATVSRLETALAHVLRADDDTVRLEAEKQPADYRSPLVQALDRYSTRVGEISERLRRLMERLDV